MSRILAPFAAALLTFTLLTLACNGGSGPTSSPGSEETPASQPPGTPSQQKSPVVATQQPSAIASATPTATASPQMAGTPAVAPADLSKYQGQTITQEDCQQFDPRTSTAVCPSRGTYTLVPPFTGEDISCSVLIVQGKPIAVRCSSQQPLQTVYYEIKG